MAISNGLPWQRRCDPLKRPRPNLDHHRIQARYAEYFSRNAAERIVLPLGYGLSSYNLHACWKLDIPTSLLCQVEFSLCAIADFHSSRVSGSPHYVLSAASSSLYKSHVTGQRTLSGGPRFSCHRDRQPVSCDQSRSREKSVTRKSSVLASCFPDVVALAQHDTCFLVPKQPHIEAHRTRHEQSSAAHAPSRRKPAKYPQVDRCV
jgi:hypothetical protein